MNSPHARPDGPAAARTGCKLRGARSCASQQGLRASRAPWANARVRDVAHHHVGRHVALHGAHDLAGRRARRGRSRASTEGPWISQVRCGCAPDPPAGAGPPRPACPPCRRCGAASARRGAPSRRPPRWGWAWCTAADTTSCHRRHRRHRRHRHRMRPRHRPLRAPGRGRRPRRAPAALRATPRRACAARAAARTAPATASPAAPCGRAGAAQQRTAPAGLTHTRAGGCALLLTDASPAVRSCVVRTWRRFGRAQLQLDLPGSLARLPIPLPLLHPRVSSQPSASTSPMALHWARDVAAYTADGGAVALGLAAPRKYTFSSRSAAAARLYCAGAGAAHGACSGRRRTGAPAGARTARRVGGTAP